MRLLIIKTSSLGDVVHMLPALTEAAAHIPGLRADWVVEEAFAPIPAWHPAVDRVLPVAIRRWRKTPFAPGVKAEFSAFKRRLQEVRYDLVLDSQGLIKSAALALLARGPRAGLDWASAREPLASLAYGRRHPAPRALHAITRNRLLTAAALGYPLGDEADIRHGLTPPPRPELDLPERYLVALHGTARPEKEYPEQDWRTLLAALPLPILLPWGSLAERTRAERLALGLANVEALPRLPLDQMGGVIAGAEGVVGVDTGLMHLAAAFRRPGVGLYPSTPPERFGARSEPGAPLLVNLTGSAILKPEKVAETLTQLLDPAGKTGL
jgi:heptosyltransferase-1